MPIDKTKNLYYLPKGGFSNALENTSLQDYNKTQFGDLFSGLFPQSASIAFYCLPYSSTRIDDRKYIYALKNVLNSYIGVSPHYEYSSSIYGNKETQKINLIAIPSAFYGSSIDKGSVKLEYYISGTLISKLEDINKNGELIQTTGSNGYDNVAGVILYNEGFIILTGSWQLDASHQEIYESGSSADYPRWLYFGAGNSSCSVNAPSSSYDLEFDGVNYINTITMFAHAEKNDLNHSNNPTYIEYSNISNLSPLINTNTYLEKEFLTIKNTTKYPYENYTGSLEKQTFITKIGIFDQNKNLIAVAKISKPIKKTENRDFTFKLKLDI